jgi:tetratricopeptide (TPR) repeat protein
MRIRTLATICLMICMTLFVFLSSASAQMPGMPPHIERIINKAQSGENITAQEQDALEKWGRSMEGAQGEGVSGTLPAGEPAGEPGAEGITWPEKVKIKDLPSKAPTREAYLGMLKEINQVYGQKLGKDRLPIDAALARAKRRGEGSDMGALFLAMGAGSASIYTTTWTAMRAPDDVLTASNLGVALSGMGDHRLAVSVLLHADKGRPNTPLFLLNLGWAYYNMGDSAGAKRYFERAASIAPDYAPAQIGLGLVAAWQGDRGRALIHLRKGLAGSYSRAAAAAYRGIRSAGRQPGKGSPDSKPISTDRDSGQPVHLPDPPVYPTISRMAGSEQALQDLSAGLDGRIRQLQQELQSLNRVLGKQMGKAAEVGADAVLLPRAFEKELFLLEDITVLVLGEPSESGTAIQDAGKLFDEMSRRTEKLIPIAEDEWRRMEKAIGQQEQLLEQQNAELENLWQEWQSFEAQIKPQMERCDRPGMSREASDACYKPLSRQYDARWEAYQRKKEQIERKYESLSGQEQYKKEQVTYRTCLMEKGMLDDLYTTNYKSWKTMWDAHKRGVSDYYAFTNPILAEVYAPTLNEILNVHRELLVLSAQRNILGMGANLPEVAEKYYSLTCVEPQPPQESEKPKEQPKLGKKKPSPCPFKKPLSLDAGFMGVELDCTYFKLSAGQGLIGSVKRDFVRHETTLGVGVGAGLDANIMKVGGSMMVNVTVGPGDTVRDVSFTSSVEGQIGVGPAVGGGVEATWSLQGGPDISTSTKGGVMPLPEMADFE